MSETKISLSPEELSLAMNAEIILTKNAVIEKTKSLLNSLQDRQQVYLDSLVDSLEPVIYNSSPKISKGENYRGLPYMVLDYPRIFDKENTAAIRTIFWWGNFFSVTLHLSGKYKKAFTRDVLNAYQELHKKNFYCCINDLEWEHHFDPDNYIPVKKLSYNDFEKIIEEKNFLKLAYKVPLEKWNEAEEKLYAIFIELMEILNQAPSR